MDSYLGLEGGAGGRLAVGTVQEGDRLGLVQPVIPEYPAEKNTSESLVYSHLVSSHAASSKIRKDESKELRNILNPCQGNGSRSAWSWIQELIHVKMTEN